jgi:hypothetical protein
MDKKNIVIVAITVAIIIGGGSFFGGMKFQQSKGSGFIQPADFQNFRNLSQEERQQGIQGFGVGISDFRRIREEGQVEGGFASGEVIYMDDKSATLKLKDGGSKIVFISDTTEIINIMQGSFNDLGIGKDVVVNGTMNSDGSITARTIQTR